MLTSFEKRSSAGARRKKKELWNPVSVSLMLEAEVPLNQDEVRGTQGHQEKEGVRNVLKSLAGQVPKGKYSEVDCSVMSDSVIP